MHRQTREERRNTIWRPVISSVNSHKEKISAYVDIFGTRQPIKRTKVLGKLSVECSLATLDVLRLYTNIDIDEGLTVIQDELMKTNRDKPSPRTLTCLLAKVLRLNNFTFNYEYFIQIKGIAMHTRVAPNFANVDMGRFQENFVYKSEWFNYLVIWLPFIDDIFLITEFIDHLYDAVASINFKQEISTNSINFLDTTVLKDRQVNISADVRIRNLQTHIHTQYTGLQHIHHTLNKASRTDKHWDWDEYALPPITWRNG